MSCGSSTVMETVSKICWEGGLYPKVLINTTSCFSIVMSELYQSMIWVWYSWFYEFPPYTPNIVSWNSYNTYIEVGCRAPNQILTTKSINHTISLSQLPWAYSSHQKINLCISLLQINILPPAVAGPFTKVRLGRGQGNKGSKTITNGRIRIVQKATK